MLRTGWVVGWGPLLALLATLVLPVALARYRKPLIAWIAWAVALLATLVAACAGTPWTVLIVEAFALVAVPAVLWARKPRAVLIACAVAEVAIVALAASLCFDWLFEACGAHHTGSLVQHLGARSLLAVFAHADDETLVAGALADAGGRGAIDVRTITLTRGENGYAQPHVCRREDLPLVRESELRRYGFALGIGHQEVWDYPDGGLDGVPDAGPVDRLVGRIREWKPDLVLTFDPAGGYNGHPDHKATGAITTKAVRAALSPKYRPELGEPHRPKYLVYVVAPGRAWSAVGGPALRAVAAVQPAPTLSVPVAPSLRLSGWRIHESQHLDQAYPLPGWLLFDFWDKEHYVVVDPVIGPD